MIDYQLDFNGMDMPWVESPFFYDLLESVKMTEDQYNLAKHFHEEGYVVLDLELDDDFIDSTIVEINNKIKSDDFKSKRHEYADIYWKMRERRGVTKSQARRIMRDRAYFGSMMLVNNEADVLLSGSTRSYPEALKPPLEIIGKQSSVLAGIYIVVTKKGPIFFADTTINKNPTEDQLLEITLLTADAVKRFGIKPVISLLSYSNFGSSKDDETLKIQNVVKRLQSNHPSLIVDGEMQANFALNQDKRKGVFPFSKLQDKKVNTLIFPNLVSGNVSYKILQELSNVETMGPVLLGMNKSVHVLQLESSVTEIVHMATIASVDAHERK